MCRGTYQFGKWWPVSGAWRDSLRTTDWEELFSDPIVSLEQIKELLAIA